MASVAPLAYTAPASTQAPHERSVSEPSAARGTRARVTAEVLARYDRPGPRYTSYPTAVEFHAGFTPERYAAKLDEAAAHASEPLSLYLHIPFCEERCTFCGCNVIITQKAGVADRYLDGLIGEIRLIASHLGDRRGVMQYHWGGGTPTYLTPSQIERLHAAVASEFTIEPGAEVAIEVDPRVTTREQLELLARLGWNRVSLGVQDFTPAVQEAVNRNQTLEETREIFHACRDLGFESINVDLIYGLPLQTEASFARSVDEVIALGADRIACYSFAMVPWIKSNQRGIEEDQLPDRDTKFALFGIALERFLAAGYWQIGMDHFAKATDELSRAVDERRLRRNFMGYTVLPASDMIGLGVSAIGEVRGAFAQNTKKLSEYYAMIEAGRPPIERGYELAGDDWLRRRVIHEIMCNFAVEIAEIEREFAIRFDEFFARELEELREGPAASGFLEIRPERLVVTEIGRLFVRNIAMAFDRHLREKRGEKPVFSRTV
jgi:oxygen-independent coproporphyrinogen-3 oxidase